MKHYTTLVEELEISRNIKKHIVIIPERQKLMHKRRQQRYSYPLNSTTEEIVLIVHFVIFLFQGVMDDRGKFIYISEEELKNVAKFIRQRGRISIADLAESSNTLIKLQEKEKPASQQGAETVDVSA